VVHSIHQPLHAIMVLLAEIERDSKGAAAALSRQAIDIIFAFIPGNEGIIPGTSDANRSLRRSLGESGIGSWDYIHHLRRSTWEQAGWDAADTLSREHAAHLCEMWAAAT
jgi:hypothetical protein